MTPTLVFKDGQPILSAGAAGGPTIITQTLLLISNILDQGLEPNAALKQPRFHHQWNPDALKIEISFDESTLKRVEALGHKLEKTSGFGACQCVFWDAGRKLLVPAHDPRIPGKADGW
jgi:gamma-glutamyltranspeptidase/glutathione hydrolase